MVFETIIRLAKYSAINKQHTIKLQFFQSSYPYLKYNQLVRFQARYYNRARWFFSKNPFHPGNNASFKDFITLDNGHYGMYYSIFNHESERQQRQLEHERYLLHYFLSEIQMNEQTQYGVAEEFEDYHRRRSNNYQHRRHRHRHHRHHHHHRHCLSIFHIKFILLGFTAKYLISKAIIDSPLNIENVKSITTKILSSLAFRPHSYLAIASTANAMTPSTSMQTHVSSVFSSGIAKRSFTTTTQPEQQKNVDDIPVPNIVELIKNSAQHSAKEEHQQSQQEVDTFDTDFLATQITNITNAYEKHTSPQELNIIYPLYQSIKRNDLHLPSIELYNLVLNSIVKRNLDSEIKLSSIESKLTNLLTVYSDILNAGLKPNNETYNIVLEALLDGSLACVDVSAENTLQYGEIVTKSKEFVQISVELFNSIPRNQLDLTKILPKLLTVLNQYPELINTTVIHSLSDLIQTSSQSKEFYISVIELSKYFSQFKILDSKDVYEIISTAYDSYKQLPDVDEFKAYGAVITALVCSSNIQQAGQFLDTILLDYKNSLQFETRPAKKQIGDLIAAFIKNHINKTGELLKGYELLERFNSIAYIPELPVSFYNFIICKFINELPNNENLLEPIWKLYNRVAIRQDFQTTSTIEMLKQNGASCRDLLLSLSISRGDHEHIFQLLKEIMLKEHLIADLEAMKKACDYLYNGVIFNKQPGEFFNQYYFGLLSNLLEIQSRHYRTSTDVNDYLSEFITYFMVQTPPELATNEMAVQSVNDYNVKLFMNSTMVWNAINNVDLATDNLYGLVIIARQLMNYTGNETVLLAKIAQFEAILINQFEDPDNHYIELTSEMIDFRQSLKEHFKHLVEATNQAIQLTPAMIETCDYLNIQNQVMGTQEVDLKCELDISYLLTIYHEKGVRRFLELFHQGYNFQFNTWNAIINYNFIVDILLVQSQIKISQFVERLWSSNMKFENKLDLTERLIEHNFGNLNYHIASYLYENGITDTKLLAKLFESSAAIKDRPPSKIMTQETYFPKIYENNKDVEWMEAYFNYLVSREKYELISKLFKQCGLSDPKVAVYLLEADLQIDLNSFESHFVQFFKGVKLNEKMGEALIRYRLALSTPEATKNILDKYAKLRHVSTELSELISYAKLLYSVQTSTPITEFEEHKSIKELSLQILSSGDIEHMRDLYEHNRRSILKESTSENFTTLLFEQLTRVAKQVPNDSPAVMNKFYKVLKFIKLINKESSELPVSAFQQILEFLRITKSEEVIRLIIKRVLNDNQILDVINFYFLEVHIFDHQDQRSILKSLYYLANEFELVDDIKRIDEYCEFMKWARFPRVDPRH
ncbi:RPM2 [[Candida] subhashii]|uniref:RPM2 n=1 Tax=[Candida] subhashii TaxID=561895 RepID=A0A8J5USJ0_9ASCO|nr:RPM2 [[Candida] subhashii]KAG7660740.1 RPM2 [[Candida] subhashii]